MPWFDTDGKMSENIIFSKFTYVRNLADTYFANKDPDGMADIISRTESLLKKNGFHSEDIAKKGRFGAMSYCEMQYVDSDFPAFTHKKALFFNEPCSLCVSVGGANIFNISAILPGASVREAYKISSCAEELIDSEFDFAYHKDHGYLSPLPSLCGNGIRICSALYLPLLTRACKIDGICRHLSQFGITLYPLFSRQCMSDIYVMTYYPKSTDEEEFVSLFEKSMLDIEKLEQKEKSFLGEDKRSSITDRGNMALGGLAYSVSLSEHELVSKLSDIRLSVCCGHRSKLIKDVSPAILNSLLFENLPCTLMSGSKNKISSEEALCEERGMSVRRTVLALPEKNSLICT